jgi:hypothetical protein
VVSELVLVPRIEWSVSESKGDMLAAKREEFGVEREDMVGLAG